jgi:hypothetical protein
MKVLATFASLTALALPRLSAQEAPAESGQHENYEFQTHSDLVFLPTVVQKKNGEITTTSNRGSSSSETMAFANW